MPKPNERKFIATSPIYPDFVLNFDNIRCGILGGQAYTVEIFENNAQMLQWAKHNHFFFKRMAENLDNFITLVEEGKVIKHNA